MKTNCITFCMSSLVGMVLFLSSCSENTEKTAQNKPLESKQPENETPAVAAVPNDAADQPTQEQKVEKSAGKVIRFIPPVVIEPDPEPRIPRDPYPIDPIPEPLPAPPPEFKVKELQEPQVYDIVEEPASFPGGLEKMRQYLAQNIKYPTIAMEEGIQGKVYLKFLVNDQGAISNVRVLRGVHPEIDKEAMRVVKAMPNWIPAKNNGKVVNSYFNLPIAFKLP